MGAQTLKVRPLLSSSPHAISLADLDCPPKSGLNRGPRGLDAESLLGPGDQLLVQLDRRSAHHAYILTEGYVQQRPGIDPGVPAWSQQAVQG